MSRSFNFNAGPAALPLDVLEIAQKELTDFGGTGMSIMEHSHRGKAYDAVHEEAIANITKLLNLSDDYQVLFSAPESATPKIQADATEGGLRITRIGTFALGTGLTALMDGTAVNLPETLGFEHG